MRGFVIRVWPVAALFAGAVALVAFRQSQSTPPIRGFSTASAAREHALESRFAAMLSRDSTGKYFREQTAVPHPAGTDANRALAERMVVQLRGFGWEDVRLRRYDVLMPFPEQVSVTMTAPSRYEATLREDVYPQDPDTRADPGLTYLGMSASGDVTGELIYANSGNPADYDWLESQGVSVRGKIAIVRYSNPYSYRGFKALTAEQRGLRALIIYSDPQEDGYRKGLTFPDGPWGPESHIQRGSITYDFIQAGDPLTPGWASVPGARRLEVAESRSVPKIIMVPISARDATPLLRALAGPVAPAGWQGALPFTYRVGAGPATVRVNVQMDGRVRAIYDVEARINGSELPDELVVIGNHHDAWVYGGVDPSSGTATQLELARALGALAREGRRPRRTIVFTSWDAEEWHLTGSTEWGEELADTLRQYAVAYLNVDGSTSGSNFGASAVASLNQLIVESARDVPDPDGKGSVLDAWARHTWAGDTSERRDSLTLVTNKLGSGSDYTVFLNFLGIPVVDMAFGGPYGVYHSIYDNYYWMTKYGDPGFRYMTTMADLWGRMTLRLANADVLPFDFVSYADQVAGFLTELEAVPGVKERLALDAARAATLVWHRAAVDADATARRVMAAPPGGARNASLSALNEALRLVEREWILADGIPGRPWFKHVLYAPKYTYAALELPGVREAVDAGNWPVAVRELERLTVRIAAVAAAVQRAADLRR
ncbi:MAG: M28 family metallopeptidase [Gemmatimonadetes bacterium]|nr:M28 family metallopeptidase [Gemmatimonadota bacterium]